MDLALNNQQWLMCHKIKPNQTTRQDLIQGFFYSRDLGEVRHELKFCDLLVYASHMITRCYVNYANPC